METRNNPEPGDNEAPEPELQRPTGSGEESPQATPPDGLDEDVDVEDGEMGETGGLPPGSDG
jgi:hypothetical protein